MRTNHTKKRGKIAVILLTLTILVSIIFVHTRIKLKIEEISTHYCKITVSEIINQSVSKVLNENNIEYSDLVSELYDENNNITSVKVKTNQLNFIQTQILSEINSQLSNISRNKIEIPIGTVSGSYFFSGRGPEIEIKFLPSGSVSSEMKSDFSSAGINQSCHKIVMNITAEMTAVFPSGNSKTSVDVNCIIAETIIVGDIPKEIIGKI